MNQFELRFSGVKEEPRETRFHSASAEVHAADRMTALQPLSVRVKEACRLTGIGRSKLYELIAAGEVEIIKVGTITLVPMDSLRRFLDRCRSA